MIVCLDVTEELNDVVGFEYIKGGEVAEVIRRMEAFHAAWPSAHWNIEVSGLGWPIYEAVRIRESHKHEFVTTKMS